MERLSCKFCQRMSREFTILRCDHVACAECLWSQLKASLGGGNTVRCPCGQLSTFTSKSFLASQAATVHASINASPRRRYQSASRPLRTEMTEMSRVREPTPERRSRRKSTQVSNSDLSRQLEFLDIQFKKSIEEIGRNYRFMVEAIHHKYENLVKNIRLFWLQEIVQSEPLHCLNISKLFDRKYHKSIGHRLKNLNEIMLENIANFKENTLTFKKIEIPLALRDDDKENRWRAENNKMERDKLLKTIQNLKQQGRGLKKGPKKVPKYKFF